MTSVALVTILILIYYIILMILVGKARGASGIKAPACTGDEIFERHFRVQYNTIEQLVVALPSMWLCAHYFRADVAAILGLIFLLGRIMYGLAYIKDPSGRTLGMMTGFLASIAMIGCSLYGLLF